MPAPVLDAEGAPVLDAQGAPVLDAAPRVSAAQRLAELVEGTDPTRPMMERVIEATRKRLNDPKVPK